MTAPRASKQKQPVRRHVPLRRCVMCRQQRPQAELVRVYRDSQGQWQLDIKRNAGGRGAWVCGMTGTNPSTCVSASAKTLQRFFRGQANRVYDMLEADVLRTKVSEAEADTLSSGSH